MKKIAYILHGFLFAAGSGIYIYVNTSDAIIFISPSDVFYPTIFSIALFLLFLGLAHILSRNLESASLMASFLILGFFYQWSTFLAILLIGSLSLLAIKISFKKIEVFSIHLLLNAISIAVVLFCLFRFFQQTLDEPVISSRTTIQPIHNSIQPSLSQATTPDIYYIILDSYGRSDMLLEVLKYDNTSFINELTQRGFIVAAHSQSNYSKTITSISSSLNMQYLDRLSLAMGNSDAWWPITNVIQQNEVRRILEGSGYKTVFFASGWDFTDIRDGDYYEAPYSFMLKDFENAYLNGTNLRIFRNINRLGIAYPSFETHRQIILNILNTLPRVAQIPGPKFVFAHIDSPHPPYVFDRMGNPIDPGSSFSLLDTYKLSGSYLESRNRFVDQMMFINQKVLTSIDGILANSPNPPIIILQGDHGSEVILEQNTTDNICLLERFSILNAFYLPGVDASSIPMDISPVNSFRYLFNQYFNSKLDILPNKQYFSPNANVFLFTEVTGQSQNPCNVNSD